MNAPATMTLPDAGIKHTGLAALISACDIQLPGGQKLALIAIARCRDSRTGRSTVSLPSIGKRCGLSGKQAGRHVEALVACGLVSRVGKLGLCWVYMVNLDALAQAVACNKPATGASGPVDNSIGTPDSSATDPGHFEQPPRTFPTMTPDMGVPHSVYSLGITLRGESETCAPAADLVGTTFPPLPILEDLKTEQPEQPAVAKPVEPAIDADVLAELAAARADHGMAPLAQPDIELLADSAAAIGIEPTTLAGWRLGELRTAEPLVDAATLAAINAQRTANGKREPLVLAELVEQASLVGLTPTAAARWILAKPSRTFLLARYYRPEPSAATQPAPIDEAAKAQARAAADTVQAALLRRSIEAMRAPVLTGQPSTQLLTRANPRTVTRCTAGVTALGGRAAGLIDNERVLRDYAAGRPFKVAQFEHALAVTGRPRAELRTQRATAKAGLVTSMEGAAA